MGLDNFEHIVREHWKGPSILPCHNTLQHTRRILERPFAIDFSRYLPKPHLLLPPSLHFCANPAQRQLLGTMMHGMSSAHRAENPCRQLEVIRESVPPWELGNRMWEIPLKAKAAPSTVTRKDRGWWPPPTPNGRPRGHESVGGTWTGASCGRLPPVADIDDDAASNQSAASRTQTRPRGVTVVRSASSPMMAGSTIGTWHPSPFPEAKEHTTKTIYGYFGYEGKVPHVRHPHADIPAMSRPYRIPF